MRVVYGYLVSYLYVIGLLAAVTVIKKFSKAKSNDAFRKSIHFLVSFTWLPLTHFLFGTWHFIVIPLSFILFTAISMKLNLLKAVKRSNSDGTDLGIVHYSISMTLLCIVATVFPVHIVPAGIGVFALSFGDSMASVFGQTFRKRNRNITKTKTVVGSFSCFIFAMVGTLVLRAFVSFPIGAGSLLIIGITAALMEVIGGRFDNYTVPIGTTLVSIALLHRGAEVPFIVGILLAVILFSFTYFGKHLTISGAILAAFIVALFSFFSLWNMLFLLLITYAVLMIADKAFSRQRTAINNGIQSKPGARSAKQILANGFVALLSTALYAVTENRAFLVVFAIGVGATLADSIASDIGVLSKSAPRDICTLKRTTPGLSGGISVLGIVVSITASLGFSIIAFFILNLSFSGALIILVLSFSGGVIDSLLGSRVQAKYQCSICSVITEKTSHCDAPARHVSGVKLIGNCAVNYISNLAVCGLGLAWAIRVV